MKMKHRIMLIDPPGFEGVSIGRILGSFGTNKADQVWPPYDLQIMAGYCKKEGHKFKILDANNLKMDYEDVKFEIKKYNPDWVIYITSFPTFLLDAQTAFIAKEVNKKIKTICMTMSMLSINNIKSHLKKIKEIDFIPWGEPEIPVMALLNDTKPKKIRGIYYHDDTGKLKFSGGIAEKAKNLDIFGIPVHSALPIRIYKCPMALKLPMTIVNCSRGCTNKCVHCQSRFQSPIRYRSVGNVIKELDEIKSLGIKEIKFYDCTLPSNRRFIEELCKKMIEKKYNFSWNCNSRAEVLDEKLLGLMKKAGCHTIAIGCESSDRNILNKMGKNETPEQIEHAVKLVKRAGMRVLMYLTFGLEGESEETMKKTFEFAKKLNPEFVTFGIVVPAIGTPFYESLKQKGYLINKKLENQDPNALPSFEYPNLSSKTLHEFTRRAYKKYYFRPGYVWMRLKNLKSLTELQMTVSSALSIIKRYSIEKIR